TATMTIGPLSFVGLMAPHIARMMGFRRTMPHIVISALVGGLLLVFADADANCAAAVSGLPDGDRDNDHWSVEFCWFNGTAYCADDGLSTDDATHRNFG
ncbi:iron chelate uptake ABC transporter family permease subunit, partial [Pseudomonas aeruginosa]